MATDSMEVTLSGKDTLPLQLLQCYSSFFNHEKPKLYFYIYIYI